jgi:hypothetical protein
MKVTSRYILNQVDTNLNWCIQALQALPGSREVSLTITKLQEALMWSDHVSTSKTDAIDLPD